MKVMRLRPSGLAQAGISEFAQSAQNERASQSAPDKPGPQNDMGCTRWLFSQIWANSPSISHKTFVAEKPF